MNQRLNEKIIIGLYNISFHIIKTRAPALGVMSLSRRTLRSCRKLVASLFILERAIIAAGFEKVCFFLERMYFCLKWICRFLLIMANSLAENLRAHKSFGQILHTPCPERKSHIQMKNTNNKKLNQSAFSVVFNETCKKVWMLPKYSTYLSVSPCLSLSVSLSVSIY